MRSVRDDLTTKARIRDTAITYFGENGFAASTVRAIAAAAGVSPALVIHHYGSKDQLRAACDARVAELVDEATREATTDLSPGGLIGQLSRRPEMAFLSPYLTRVLSEGGVLAEQLFARMVDDTVIYLRSAVAAGVVRPTDDEPSRALLLAVLSLGSQLLWRYLVPPGTSQAAAMAQISERFTRPSVELLTYGMFTGPEYLHALDAYLEAGRPVAEGTE